MRAKLIVVLGLILSIHTNVCLGQTQNKGHQFVANQGPWLHQFDAEGKHIWQMKLSAAPHDMHRLGNGNLLTHQKTEVVEIDLVKKKVVWAFDVRKVCKADKIEVHSVAPLPDNKVMVAISGERKIVEIDRKGSVVHSLNMKVDNPHPHRDTRLVRPLDDGGYLVAHEGDGFVREYSRDGDVTWEFEIPLFGKSKQKGHGVDSFGNSVFSAIRLKNGNTLIGTGNGHSVIEVSPQKKIVWQLDQNDLQGIQLAWVTTLEVLPDGAIVIGNCHAGKNNPQLIKIDHNKNVLWKFSDFEKLGNSVSNSQILDVAGKIVR